MLRLGSGPSLCAVFTRWEYVILSDKYLQKNKKHFAYNLCRWTTWQSNALCTGQEIKVCKHCFCLEKNASVFKTDLERSYIKARGSWRQLVWFSPIFCCALKWTQQVVCVHSKQCGVWHPAISFPWQSALAHIVDCVCSHTHRFCISTVNL